MSNKAGKFITSNEQTKTRKGYWLVRSSDEERFFISEKVSEPALERVCNKVLNNHTGYDYWIDYCLGYDVNGMEAWSNLDHTDSFI